MSVSPEQLERYTQLGNILTDLRRERYGVDFAEVAKSVKMSDQAWILLESGRGEMPTEAQIHHIADVFEANRRLRCDLLMMAGHNFEVDTSFIGKSAAFRPMPERSSVFQKIGTFFLNLGRIRRGL